MGGTSRWDDTSWNTYSSTVASKPAAQIFKSTKGIHPGLNPLGLNVRESRDSDINPNSTPVIVALDVTGSMLIENLSIAEAEAGEEGLVRFA